MEPEKPGEAPQSPSKRGPSKPRTVSVHTLQQEMKRWQKLKIADQMCFKLLRLYVGEPEHLDAHGIYRMSSLFYVAAQLCSKHSRTLLDMICLSGSFYFLVKPDYSKVYGFFSKLTINEKGLSNYRITNEEIEGMPLANLRLANLRQPARNFATGNKEYMILMSIHPKEIIPPTEEPRLSGLRAKDFLPWDSKSDLAKQEAQAAGRSGASKSDNGSARDFFHEMKLSEEGQKTVIKPLREMILKRFPLTPGEANIVLGNLVVQFLIPMFDRKPEFRTTSTAGRVRWLTAVSHKDYFVNDLQHAYNASLKQLDDYRRKQAAESLQQQRNQLRSYRPLSPYEWTNPNTGARRYEDAQGRVFDLPADAPARPSEQARWNPFILEWEENGDPSEENEPESNEPESNEPQNDEP